VFALTTIPLAKLTMIGAFGLAALGWAAPTLAAETASGCATLAAEPVTLPAGGPSVHHTGAVPLHAGETLHLQISGEPGSTAQGSITLDEDGEAGGPLVSGAAPQTTSLTVPMDGLYSLEYRADGAAPLTFNVDCDGQTSAALSPTSPEAFVERRTGRLLSDDTSQASLRRRLAKPDTLDKAIQRTTVLDENGDPTQVTVATSVQSLAAGEGKKLANDKFDVWVEGRGAQFDQQLDDNGTNIEAKGRAGNFYLGADYLLQPGLMVGALLHLDNYGEDYARIGSSANSQGVEFGPYASMRLMPDMFLDIRAAWGGSDNEENLADGTRVAYDTDRQVFRSQLSGKRNLYGFEITPSVAFSVIEDRFSDPARLPEGSVDDAASVIGRLGVGSAVSYRFALDDGSFLQPNAALSTGWNFDHFVKSPADVSNFSNDTGAKAEAGLTLGTSDGISIAAGGALEGIGQADYSAWSGRISLTAPLN
jgi:Autotransporter beta-domain